MDHKKPDEHDSSDWDRKSFQTDGLATLTREVKKGFDATKEALHQQDIKFAHVESQMESLFNSLEEVKGKFGVPGGASLETRVRLCETSQEATGKELKDIQKNLWMLGVSVLTIAMTFAGGVILAIVAALTRRP